MPIVDGVPTYQMSDGIRGELSREVLLYLHDKMMKWYIQNTTMDSTREFTVYGFYVYTEGNGVWQDSLVDTLTKFKLDWILEYYKHLPWYESDIFDHEVVSLMVEEGIVELGELSEEEEDEAQSEENKY